MKKVLNILFLVVVLTSCKTLQPIVTPEKHDSVRVEYRLDSVYVYERDSIYVDRFVKADTVYITKTEWKTRYKDVERVVCDTIVIDKENTIVQEVEKPKSGWDNFASWFTVIVLGLLFVCIVFRVMVYFIDKKTAIL